MVLTLLLFFVVIPLAMYGAYHVGKHVVDRYDDFLAYREYRRYRKEQEHGQ